MSPRVSQTHLGPENFAFPTCEQALLMCKVGMAQRAREQLLDVPTAPAPMEGDLWGCAHPPRTFPPAATWSMTGQNNPQGLGPQGAILQQEGGALTCQLLVRFLKGFLEPPGDRQVFLAVGG